MPIYEYVCHACEKEFDQIQKISDPPLKKCNLCGSKKIEKKLSLSSFQLKGTGWYITDYARKDQEKKSKAKKEESPKAKAAKE